MQEVYSINCERNMGSTERSKAKINLNLHILGGRPDGYHELFSLVCFADYGDPLSFIVRGEHDKLEVVGEFASDIIGENIILKAARLLRLEVKDVPFGTFYLDKKLPVASGMGGGSANAAAALRLLSPYVPAEYGAAQWLKLALSLGADVPVCWQQKSVYMSGIGEKLSPALNVKPQYAVLVNPLIGVSTADIFKRLQALPFEPEKREKAGTEYRKKTRTFSSRQENFKDYLLQTRNDLEAVAIKLEPEIKTVLEVLKVQEGCFLSRMSGSGATCFGLFENKASALKAQDNISESRYSWWCVETILR